MGIFDRIRDGVSDAVDSVRDRGSSSSSSGGGRSIAERTRDAGNSTTSGRDSSSSSSDSDSDSGGRSIAERTRDAGNTTTSGRDSSSSSSGSDSDSGGRSIADRTRDAGNTTTSGRDDSSSSSSRSGRGSSNVSSGGSGGSSREPEDIEDSGPVDLSDGGTATSDGRSGPVDRARDLAGDAADTVGRGVDAVADPFERARDFVRDDSNDGRGRPDDMIAQPTGEGDLDDPDNSLGTNPTAGDTQPQMTQQGPQGQRTIDGSQLSESQRQAVLSQLSDDSPLGPNDFRIDQLEIGPRPESGDGVDEALSPSEQQRLREEAAADSIFTADQIAIESVSQTDDGARVEFATPETNVDAGVDDDFNNAQTFGEPGGTSTQQGFGMPAPATTPAESGGMQKLDKVSEIAGRDISVEQGETFGDAQELEPLDRFFGDLADSTFETAKAAGDVIGSRVEDSVQLSVGASPTTAPADDDLFDGGGPTTATGKAVSGGVQAASFPFAIPKKAVEGVEAGVYVADDPGRITEAPGKASDLLLTSAEGAAKNPAEATGALIASGGASSALFKATQGTRLGTASRLTLQPGEEALKAGFRATGRAPDRPATAAQMVGEQFNIDTRSFLRDRRGQSQLGRQRSRSSSETDADVVPEIGGDEIISDAFDSSPVRSEFRERASIEPETAELDRLRDQTASVDLRERFDSPRTSEPLFAGSTEGSVRAAALVSQAQNPEIAADVGSFGQTAVRPRQRLETALGLETETDVLSRLESESELATAVESETETATETALELETATETELGLESEFAVGTESESEFSVDFDEDSDTETRGSGFDFESDEDLFSTGISDPDDVLDGLGL